MAESNQAKELCEAAAGGSVATVVKLIGAGASLDGIDPKSGLTPLVAALRAGRAVIVGRLLKAGADPNRASADGPDHTTPLHLAAGKGDTASLEVLLDHGADVDARIKLWNGTPGCTPLMAAAEAGQAAAVALLLDRGADPAAIDQAGVTAIGYARRAGAKDIEALLREAIAAVPVAADQPQQLIAAAHDGMADRVQALIAAGVPVDTPSPRGETALKVAAGTNEAAVISALIKAGADVNARSPKGWLPITSYGMKVKTATLLLDAGADPNAGMTDGMTAMHWAFQSGDKKIVELMLKAGGRLDLPAEERDPFVDRVRRVNRGALALLQEYLGVAADPVDPAAESLKALPKHAADPAFLAASEELAALFNRKPSAWKRRKGVLLFANVSLGKHLSRHYGPAPDAEEADREWIMPLFARLQQDILARGYSLVVNDALLEQGRGPVLLFPTTDKFAVLAAVGTNGNNHGHDTQAVVRWLRDLDRERPFRLLACGHDFLEGRFEAPVADAGALARRLIEFCPDVTDFAYASAEKWTEEQIVEAVAEDLTQAQGFFLWWD